MQGMIQGGWELVGAAYAVVWGGLLAYGLSLVVRRRALLKEQGEPES